MVVSDIYLSKILVQCGFKVAKMMTLSKRIRTAIIIRKPECDELGSELNAKAALEDVGHNKTCILPYRTTRKIGACLA